jgi:hypothetical protein
MHRTLRWQCLCQESGWEVGGRREWWRPGIEPMLSVIAGSGIGPASWSTKGGLMQRLIYAMRFIGQATPASDDGTVLKAATAAPSISLVSMVSLDGLASAAHPVDGGSAIFESDVTFTGETSFQEIGSIAFGEGNVLRFGTVGSGYLGPSADPARKHGTVMWRVEGGEGQFTGASGLITSNFMVDGDRKITDHHFGVLWLP